MFTFIHRHGMIAAVLLSTSVGATTVSMGMRGCTVVTSSLMKMLMRQLRNDRVRRQNGETEDSRGSEVPRLHQVSNSRPQYCLFASWCQLPNDCIIVKIT